MRPADLLAPRYSRRRLWLKIARSALRSPRSALSRLAAVNFHNARVCSTLQIHCAVCGADAGMDYDFPDVVLRREHGIGLLRETLCCKACGATMRDRQMALGLLRVVSARAAIDHADLGGLCANPLQGLRILDTDSFSPINSVLRGMPGYSHSQYRPDLAGQERLADGSLNVDLLAMPFEPGSFDVIMTSDVMEHVAEDERAHREIFRCLAQGGTYVLTIPFNPQMVVTRRLTLPSGSASGPFVLDRHIHGDPHSSGGIIAHRIYGQDFLDQMRGFGFSIEYQELHDPLRGVFAGDLFLAHKGA